MLVERNADFINRSHGEIHTVDYRGNQVIEPPCIIEQDGVQVFELNLNEFTSAAAMAAWEFAAYNNYGGERCNAEGVETLEDLFGDNFSRLFYLRKTALHAQEQIEGAEEEVQNAINRLNSLRDSIAAWTEVASSESSTPRP